MKKNDVIPFTDVDEKLIEKIVQKRIAAQTRFPLAIAMFATFGFVSVLYGFEKMIDRVGPLIHHPWILLILGVVILAITGSVYKKLD